MLYLIHGIHLLKLCLKGDAFFDKVMVMADDEDIKQNRLSLLKTLSRQMNAVADISLLSD